MRLRRHLPLIVVLVAVGGLCFALWNNLQPRTRLFAVNQGAAEATLTFSDGRVVRIEPCTSERYSDDVRADWVLTAGRSEIRRAELTAASGDIITISIQPDGSVASTVARAVDTSVLMVQTPTVGPCAGP